MVDGEPIIDKLSVYGRCSAFCGAEPLWWRTSSEEFIPKVDEAVRIRNRNGCEGNIGSRNSRARDCSIMVANGGELEHEDRGD